MLIERKGDISEDKEGVEETKIERWIIERARSGDSKSQEVLLKHYEAKVFDLILRIVNNYEDAKDVLQDTFVKALVNIGKFDTSYDFGRWLMCIAARTSIDLLRKRKRLRTVDLEAVQEKDSTSKPSLEQELEAKTDQETIVRCIESLDPKYRTVILLRYRDDFSYSEISEALGIPLGSVKVLLHRAHKRVREMIIKGVEEC